MSTCVPVISALRVSLGKGVFDPGERPPLCSYDSVHVLIIQNTLTVFLQLSLVLYYGFRSHLAVGRGISAVPTTPTPLIHTKHGKWLI